MIVKLTDFAAKGFLAPEIESGRIQLRAELAASVAKAEAVSDRVTACLFSADVSHYAAHEILALSCSGQPTPDTALSFSSATAGASPSLN